METKWSFKHDLSVPSQNQKLSYTGFTRELKVASSGGKALVLTCTLNDIYTMFKANLPEMGDN